MNTKMVIIAAIVVLALAALYVTMTPAPTSASDTTTTSTGSENTGDIEQQPVEAEELANVINEEYYDLIQEELDNMSNDQTDFNQQAEDQIADDMSQFYYS